MAHISPFFKYLPLLIKGLYRSNTNVFQVENSRKEASRNACMPAWVTRGKVKRKKPTGPKHREAESLWLIPFCMSSQNTHTHARTVNTMRWGTGCMSSMLLHVKCTYSTCRPVDCRYVRLSLCPARCPFQRSSWKKNAPNRLEEDENKGNKIIDISDNRNRADSREQSQCV